MIDRRLIYIPAILFAIILVGTFGYHFVQPDYSFFDSIYMTIITITTIGYGEVRPLTTAGKLFNLILIGVGWVGIFSVARMSGQMLLEGELAKNLGRHKMDRQLSKLSGHYIVCGYGRVGKVVCDEFSANSFPFVIIERNVDAIAEIKQKGYLFIEGDCTGDQNLIDAGILRAKGLINAIPDVAEAVYTTLTARQQNQSLFIMARADSPNCELMLKRAGADRVISPQAAAGTRMAMSALRPNVVDFISLAAFDDKEGMRVEEIRVAAGSELIGKSFREVDIRAKYGINVIGTKKTDGKIVFNPPADYKISERDTLIMVGSVEQLAKVYSLFGSD
jgi:voltage-gated potassium channel